MPLMLAALTCLTTTVAGIEPDPEQLLRRADRALREAGTITYDAERTCVGWLATQSPNVKGSVVASRLDDLDDLLGWRVEVSGTLTTPEGESQKVQCAYNGVSAAGLRTADLLYTTGEMDPYLGPMLDSGGRLTTWMALWTSSVVPLLEGDVEYEVTYDGRAVVGEVVCDVVRLALYELEAPEFETWVFLGADHLPRRFDVCYYDDWGDAAMVTLTLSNVQTPGPAPDGAFELDLPDGYEVVEHEPVQMDFAGFDPQLAEAFNEPAPLIAVGAEAPGFTLKDSAGNTNTLADYRGEVVVLDFWATWCPPCREAMPVMQRLHEAYKGQAVSIVGMNCWESGDPVRYMEDKDFTYESLLNADETAAAYGVEGIPTLYVIDPAGIVVYSHVGYGPTMEEEIAEVIEKALDR